MAEPDYSLADTTPANGAPKLRLPTIVLPIVGIAAAALGAVLGEAETRWIVYFLGAIVLGVLWLSVTDKRRFLFVGFVMSMQADVSLRFMHGYSGSEGFAFPFAFLAGAALAAYEIGTGRLLRKDIVLIGEAKTPIILLFATSMVSIVAGNEHFVGVTRLLFEAELLFIYWVVLNVIRSKEDQNLLVRLLLVALFMQSAVYVIQSQLGIQFDLLGKVGSGGTIPRPGGTVSSNPAGYASFIVPPLMIAAAFYLRNTFLGWKVSLALLSLGATTIVLSFTRAAWGTAVLGFAFVTWLCLRRGGLSIARPTYVIVFATVVSLFAAPLISARFESAPLQDSYNERRDLMLMATRVIKAHPVAGIGAGAYAHTFKSYVRDEFANTWTYTVHNEYLLRAAETGVLGGIAWALFMLTLLRMALRVARKKDEVSATIGIGLAGAVVGLCFEMYWDAWRGFTYNAMLWLCAGLLEAMLRVGDEDTADSSAANGQAQQPRLT